MGDLPQVEAVDLDPVVISAAREAMGFPADRWGAWLENCGRSLFCGRNQMLTATRPATVAQLARPELAACCCSERLRAMQADAVDYVARLAAESPGGVDLAIIDVFDGMDITPPAVSSPGAEVSLTSCQVIRACICTNRVYAVFKNPSAGPVL